MANVITNICSFAVKRSNGHHLSVVGTAGQRLQNEPSNVASLHRLPSLSSCDGLAPARTWPRGMF